MTIRVGRSRSEPIWLDVVPGVRLQLKPFGSIGRAVGKMAVSRALASGAAPDEAAAAYTLGVAQWAIVGWEGVEAEPEPEAAPDAEEAAALPLPVTAENVAQLLEENWEVFQALDDRYINPVLLKEAEKNGSSPAPSGGSAGATPTAPPAPLTGQPAAESALST